LSVVYLLYYCHRAKTHLQSNNKYIIYMPWVGFEPMIPVLDRAKTFHALDRAATLIGHTSLHKVQFWINDIFICLVLFS
jgi:hypothetical protein